MSAIAVGILIVLLLVATATDLARHKIYNWTTYPGILAGAAANTATHASNRNVEASEIGIRRARLEIRRRIGVRDCGTTIVPPSGAVRQSGWRRDSAGERQFRPVR